MQKIDHLPVPPGLTGFIYQFILHNVATLQQRCYFTDLSKIPNFSHIHLACLMLLPWLCFSFPLIPRSPRSPGVHAEQLARQQSDIRGVMRVSSRCSSAALCPRRSWGKVRSLGLRSWRRLLPTAAAPRHRCSLSPLSFQLFVLTSFIQTGSH